MFKHAINEGTRNLFRSFWLSITAIFIIVVSLSSVAIVASAWVTAGFTLRQLDNQAVLYVNLKSDTSAEARNTMLDDVKNNGNVKTVTFIDKEDAKKDLKKNEIAGQGVTQLELISKNTSSSFDVLQESFKIYPKSAEQYNNILKFVKQDKYVLIVDSIQDVNGFIEKLKSIYTITGYVGAGLVVIFATISTLVMANILRLAIYSRRDEIEIMRLVGATNNYIRGPFIAEGVLYNLISSVIAMSLFIPTYIYLSPKISGALGIDITNDTGNLMNSLYISLLLTNVGGLFIGGFAAFWTTQKYLKL